MQKLDGLVLHEGLYRVEFNFLFFSLFVGEVLLADSIVDWVIRPQHRKTNMHTHSAHTNPLVMQPKLSYHFIVNSPNNGSPI